MGKQKRLAYFEFAKGSKHEGRVTFELYADLTPVTTAYFVDLITASKGKAGFLGTTFSKVVQGGFIVGGELKDATKPSFLNESFERRHAHAGVLSMANNQS
jgi:cyclophilin family peptidyl-prolyl cis-trans isomerase